MQSEGIGAAIPPAANQRYVRGRGRYVADLARANALVMVLVRSPHASADITTIDLTAARVSPGVVAVLSGRDVDADGLGGIRSIIERRGPDGGRHLAPPFPLLAIDRVGHAGFPIAAVIAETVAAARDGAELVAIDYAARPSVTMTRELLKPDVARVWEGAPGNVCFIHDVGDETGVELALRRAAHVVAADIDVSRVTAAPMEPRNAIGEYDPDTDRYTLWTGSQSPHELRAEIAGILGIAPSRLRVVSPDIGGAFGLRIAAGPELALVLWAARRTGRPVRWQADRSEGFQSDWHARDISARVELALDADGTFLALRSCNTANLGACLSGLTLHSPTNNLGGIAGPYRTPAIFVRVTGALSNTNPTAPYRGAGRPEATYAIEGIIDIAARQTGIDRIALRRRNLIPQDAMPFRTGLVFTYDCGAFERNMDAALDLSDWAGFPTRRADARRRGRLRGIGLANAIEIAGGPAGAPLEEFLELSFDATGDVLIVTGLHSHGHGLETVLPQVLNSTLGVALDRVRVIFGDTDRVYLGHGSGGSRSAAVGSTVLLEACRRLVDKGVRIAAHAFEADPADVAFQDGGFRVQGTDLVMGLDEVASLAFRPTRLPPGLDAGFSATVALPPAGATFPNGCHVCEVELDPDTGVIEVIGYWTVEDVGRVLNPLVVEGQIQGGVAQGLGQALFEQIRYDPGSGQLVTASFMDYAMPRATDVPSVLTVFNEVRTAANPLGVKGAGEAGTVGALAAVMNAVNDALAEAGAGPIAMPATPFRVWQTLHDAEPDRGPPKRQEPPIAALIRGEGSRPEESAPEDRR